VYLILYSNVFSENNASKRVALILWLSAAPAPNDLHIDGTCACSVILYWLLSIWTRDRLVYTLYCYIKYFKFVINCIEIHTHLIYIKQYYENNIWLYLYTNLGRIMSYTYALWWLMYYMLLYSSVFCTFGFIFYILCNIILIMFSLPVYYNNIINHDNRLPGVVLTSLWTIKFVWFYFYKPIRIEFYLFNYLVNYIVQLLMFNFTV